MTDQNTQAPHSTPVIELGDAAALTRGGESESVENKQNPYD
ncbi:albusnodin family lasso peptide [Streptomyces abikoensis]|uniref:Albusnodin family lasso peptide n=1 Tax=Streptomyces abikoensis TaxID=97398 RepID=A0ABW7TD38_9ACTN